ncbi:ubiquitin thioesterase OTUB2-like [Neosynchiropus ocellatus]
METDGLITPTEDVSTVFQADKLAAKYDELRQQFSSLRRVRGDGNCFYRACCFAYLESILHDGRALQSFKDRIICSGATLLLAGFEESSFKKHLNTLVHVVEQCQTDRQEAVLFQLFNDKKTSDSVVQFLRLLTSAHLQNHADDFCNFVEAPSLQVYCRQEVEVMAMTCDHVDILALTQALDFCIHIVSMEAGGQKLLHHCVPEDGQPALHLLYQMSHYNILYPKPPT